MKGVGLFILGFVAGVLFTLFVLFLFTFASRHNADRNEHQEKVHVEYVEIKGKKGNVRVHTGMPKDSVRALVGKPNDVDLRSVGNTTYENWNYKFSNKYITDLEIKFENGKLVGVQEY